MAERTPKKIEKGSEPPTEEWQKCETPEAEPKRLGFLQLCIERRFHQSLKNTFQTIAQLQSHEYWAHMDFGGTPKMQHEEDRAVYAYREGAVVMGWSAHGAGCGAFKPEKHPHAANDDEIREALLSEFRRKVFMYPKAEHFVLFATEEEKTKKTVVWWRGPFRAF